MSRSKAKKPSTHKLKTVNKGSQRAQPGEDIAAALAKLREGESTEMSDDEIKEQAKELKAKQETPYPWANGAKANKQQAKSFVRG